MLRFGCTRRPAAGNNVRIPCVVRRHLRISRSCVTPVFAIAIWLRF